ncbi:MAG: hypothetical protein JXA03_08185 [Bacteroidales bacterium]|nr:hypothetical protein [Bacteroidales bacterium]
MKRLIFILIVLIALAKTGHSQDFDPYTCTFKGKELFGKIQRVTSFADLKVEVVDYNADLEVDTTSSWPSKCGQWKFVQHFPDLKVEFVKYGADLRIKYVNYGAGVPESKTNMSSFKINTFNCKYKGFPLYGKVKFTDNFPDIRIKIVESFEDIRVKMVENFPDDCGEWQVVESFEDIKVKIVESFEDIKVKMVDNFPGLR